MKLLGKQQGRVITVVKGQIAKYATSTGADPTGLGRQNHIDIANGAKKLRVTST